MRILKGIDNDLYSNLVTLNNYMKGYPKLSSWIF